jgi:hypothetical protein
VPKLTVARIAAITLALFGFLVTGCRAETNEGATAALRLPDLGGEARGLVARESVTAVLILGADCAACRTESPRIRAIRSGLIGKGIAVRTVLVGSSALAARVGPLYGDPRPLIDSEFTVPRLLSVQSSPALVFLDRAGRVRSRVPSIASATLNHVLSMAAAVESWP